jgi:AraC-like DNA-binding protein
MGIAVPLALLDEPLLHPNRAITASHQQLGLVPATDLAGSLRQALASIILDRPVSIELGAEIARRSPRSLHRHLAQEGTSWRQIVNELRFEACLQLLGRPDLPLTQISHTLGYSDPSHFTRSFRRWTGEAPSTYRRKQRDDSQHGKYLGIRDDSPEHSAREVPAPKSESMRRGKHLDDVRRASR